MLNEILYRLNAEFPGALKSMHSAIGFDYNRIAGKIAETRNELRAAVWPEQTESKETAIA